MRKLKYGLMACKKCKEYFHPDWLDIHKQSHLGKGDWVGVCGQILSQKRLHN